MGGALEDSKICHFSKQPEIAYLAEVWFDVSFSSIRGRLLCSQQSHLFESWIRAEALPTFSVHYLDTTHTF